MKFELYKDKKKEWRWRTRAKNGKIVAQSSESYKNKQDCRDMIQAIRMDSVNWPIEELV